MKVEVFEVERMRKEIDNYIEHIIICHEKNDFEMMKEESISLLFWGSQMIEVNNTIRQRDAILAITESLIHRIYEKPDMYVDFFDAKMYGELGKLAFSFREIKKRTGKLKDSSEFLNRLLLRNAYQKIIRFQPDKIMFDTYDILGGIAGVTYYLLDCPEILEKPDENQKVRELVCFLVYLSEDYIYQGKEILRYHIRRKQQWLKWERSHMKRGKFMKILNRIITFVTTVFVIIACIVFAATAICKIGNIEPRIVLSGSMEPKIHTGSICFINKKVPYDKIKTGDIIAFKAGKNTMVTHRVISVTNSGFETKGDANKVSDGISTNKTNYRGKTILSIPYAGYISMYLQSTRGKIILVSVIVALFIAGLILPQEKNQEEVKNE